MITCIDFETHAINGALPPKPVGVSVKYDDQPSKYYAFGHLSNNNSTWAEAKELVAAALAGPCLFHNAAFDLSIIRYWFKLSYPKQIHDSLLLLFLEDPYAQTLALKSNAEKFLGYKPEERDLVHEWILRNVPGAKPSKAGAHISKAPVSLVGPYAEADTDLTYALFNFLYKRNKGPAYERECKLVPILVENTLEGIGLDVNALEKDFVVFTKVRSDVDKLIYNKLGMSFNIDSPDELVKAIDKSGLPTDWVYTATGKKSTAKKNLASSIKDLELINLLGYRSTLSTYLETFYTAWLDKHSNGTLHISWNQVRNTERGKSSTGTRTGRLSSVPSLLNVPKDPPKFSLDLPELPKMRQYLLPDDGELYISSDYQAQEVRILAHYDDDQLMRAYIEEPRLDMHQRIADMLTNSLDKSVTRRAAKTMVFSILYGQGITAMAEALNCTYNEAQNIKQAFYSVVPGIKNVEKSIKYNSDRNLPIKTLGGRLYYKEPSREIRDKRTGHLRYADFGYKLLNYLIQASAADMTKQAIINYNEAKKDGRFLLSVHDQICLSGPASEVKILEAAMKDIKLDVPIEVDTSIGSNFGNLHVIELV